MMLIFDLDGTLIDSSKRHKLVFKDVLEKHEISIPPKQLDEYMQYKALGNSTLDYLVAIMHISWNKARQIVDEWVSLIEEEQYLILDELYPEVLDILQKLSLHHNIVYLTARKNRGGVEQQIEQYGLANISRQLFVVSPSDAKKEKKQITKDIASVANKTIIIGDTEIEYNLACELGLDSIILNRGFRSKIYWDKVGVMSYSSLESAFVDFL